MPARLTIIAGSGALVPEVVQAALTHYDVQVLALASQSLLPLQPVTVSLDDPQGIIRKIGENRSTVVVLAGAIDLSQEQRERLAQFGGKPGAAGEAVGDTGLSKIAKAIEAMTGARLVGAHEIAPELLAPSGHIAGPELGPGDLETARFAIEAAHGIGRLDLGQAVVVAGRHVIAAEDIGGTDALLARVALYRQQGLVGGGRRLLVLGKACKPDQPLFVDLPAIGPTTIVNAAAAGIGVIALEAGRTLLIGRADLIAAANARGVTVVGLDPGHG